MTTGDFWPPREGTSAAEVPQPMTTNRITITPDRDLSEQVSLAIAEQSQGKPRIDAATFDLMSKLEGRPALIDPSVFRNPSMFDARWRTYRGMGLSIDRGVAVLEIVGPLGFKLSWFNQSYDEISEMLARVRESEEARALLLNIHSPGGASAGLFDLVDEIYAMSQDMPVHAMIADVGASAAYAIASAAQTVGISQTGMAGSIGVVMTHFDYSRQMEAVGVNVTHIYAGAEKTLGTPYEPLSDSDRATLQAEIDALYDMFVSKVDRNRGDAMTEAQARETEAGVFYGDDAVRIGLADRVTSGREMLEEMVAAVATGALTGRSTQPTMEATMPNEQTETTETTEAPAAESTVNEAEVRADERARVRTILTSEHAENRTDMALHLATSTDMSADAAVALLEQAPQNRAGSDSALDAEMAGYDHGIGPEGEADADAAASVDSAPRIDRQSIFEARRQAAQR